MRAKRIFAGLIGMLGMVGTIGAQEFSKGLEEKLGMEISVPVEKVEVPQPFELSFIFGDKKHFLGAPVFEGGSIVRVSEDCSIVVMDAMFLEPQNSALAYNPDYFPVVTSWMLKVCDTHWLEWYIEGRGGVLADKIASRGFPALSDEERAEVKKKIRKLRSKHERQIDGGVLLEKVNCDKIIVTRIPRVDEIRCLTEKYDIALKSNLRKCYGVEFYKEGRTDALRMLAFVHGKTSVDKVLADICDYIRFK